MARTAIKDWFKGVGLGIVTFAIFLFCLHASGIEARAKNSASQREAIQTR